MLWSRTARTNPWRTFLVAVLRPRRPSLRLVTSARKERRKRLKSLKICMLLRNPLTICCPAGVLGLLGQPAVCLRLNTTGTKQGEEDCATLVQIEFQWQLWWCWNCC
ncbi:uncharacterized protein [Odocoileus virginianus]|uniref:Uncharacterized protein n=1 Tax=Odocoileus virginianus TaxID=9874 RepID=A0A6J0W3E3_ODOVR